MSMSTLVFVVTYRLPDAKTQNEIIRFTKESADSAAKTIIDMGGIAVVTEDYREEVASEEAEIHPNKALQW